MSKTKIEWCDETINPIIGCSKISEGCRNCYAERMARRIKNMAVASNNYPLAAAYREIERWNGKTAFVPSALKRFPAEGKRIFDG